MVDARVIAVDRTAGHPEFLALEDVPAG